MIEHGVDPVLDVVVAALATELKVAEAVVRRAKSLKTDLKIDSISIVNVAFAIEDELGVQLDLERAGEFDSLSGIVGVVRNAMGCR
jgi:acyl carrier protein